MPDTTTRLLREHGVDTDRFWKEEVRALVHDGFDPALAWLHLLLGRVGPDKQLGPLSNAGLAEFGARLEADFFSGFPEVLDDLRQVASEYRDTLLEFYIVSGGLRALVEGVPTVRRYFKAVYASELAEDPNTGVLAAVSRVVSFTEKTRYLFEINKGIAQEDAERNPYLVNQDVAPARRRIPMKNMIYLGDGLTDIPCFSLLKSMGGTSFGVFDPAKTESAKRAFLEFLKPARVVSMHAPRYRPNDELGAFLRTAVATRAAQILVEQAQA